MVTAKRLLVLSTIWPLLLAGVQTRVYNHSDMASVVLFIVRERLSKLSTTLVVAEQRATPDPHQVNTHLLQYILQNMGDEISVQLYFGDGKLQLWEYYVFIVDSAAAFRALQFKFPRNYYERRFYFFIILTEQPPNLLRVLRRIFIVCSMFHVIDVALLVNDPQLGVCLYTYRLFTADKCLIVQPVLQYRFRLGFDRLGDVFENKLQNLYRCPLRVSLRVMPPHIIFSGDAKNTDTLDVWNSLSGIEGEMLKLIASKMNFTIKLLPFMEDNFAPNHFEELKAGRADVAVGGFSGSDTHRWEISPSSQYHQSPYVYAIRVHHDLASFDRLSRPFAPKVWWLLGLLLLTGTAAIYALRILKPEACRFVFGNRNETPLGNFFAVFLGYPVFRVPGRNFARFLLGIWLLITFVLRNAYQCALYDAIRLDKFAQTPSGFEDLMKWDFKILISRDIRELSAFPRNENVVIVGGDYLVRLKMIKEQRKRLAMVLLYDTFHYYVNMGHDLDVHIQVLPEVIYNFQMVMYFPKHSIFVEPFNKKLQSLASSGIFAAICSRFYSVQPFSRSPPQNSKTKPLMNKRLMSLYTICFWGLVGAAVVFVLEVLSKKSPRLRAVVDWIQ